MEHSDRLTRNNCSSTVLLVEQDAPAVDDGKSPAQINDNWDIWLEPGRMPEETFGDEVRRARETRGWSQETLVRHLQERTGVTLHSTAITKIERPTNRRALRANELAALAYVLGISPGYFLTARDRITDDAHYDAVKAEAARLTEEVERDDGVLAQRTAELATIQRGAEERRQRLDRIRRMLAGYDDARHGDLWAGTEWSSTAGGER